MDHFRAVDIELPEEPAPTVSSPSPASHHVLPPRIQQDWPRIALETDEARGVVTRTLGLELSSVFQSIVTPDGRLHGEEALLRARSHGLKISPLSVFRIAAAQGVLVPFDRLVRTLHLINFISRPDSHGRLYLNVHPRLLGEVSQHGVVFEEILHSVSWEPGRVTLELREEDVVPGDFPRLRAAVNNYRQRGYGIAIDDFGGYQHNRLDRLHELAPDVVKLDRDLLLRSEGSGQMRVARRDIWHRFARYLAHLAFSNAATKLQILRNFWHTQTSLTVRLPRIHRANKLCRHAVISRQPSIQLPAQPRPEASARPSREHHEQLPMASACNKQTQPGMEWQTICLNVAIYHNTGPNLRRTAYKP